MTASPDKPARRSAVRAWLRRRLQLRLRTLLLLTTAAALGIWWWQQPYLRERVLANGLHVREHFRLAAKESAAAASSEADELVRHGPYRLSDDLGWVLCRGSYREGLASGRWTFYYPDRRPQLSGLCEDGDLVGPWKSWHRNGQLRSLVRFARPAPGVAYRDGEAEAWHENGQRRWQGRFEAGQRHGTWRHWNADGVLVAAGRYDRGLREGIWEFSDGGRTWRREFAAGHLASEPSVPAPSWPARLFIETRQSDVDGLLSQAESDPPDEALSALETLSRIAFEIRQPPSPTQLSRLRRLTEHEDQELRATAAVALTALSPESFDEQFARLARWSANSAYLRSRVAELLTEVEVSPSEGFAAWLTRDVPACRLAIACLDARHQDGWLNEIRDLTDLSELPKEIHRLFQQRLIMTAPTDGRQQSGRQPGGGPRGGGGFF